MLLFKETTYFGKSLQQVAFSVSRSWSPNQPSLGVSAIPQLGYTSCSSSVNAGVLRFMFFIDEMPLIETINGESLDFI